MVQYLNEKGLTNLLLVDDFGVEEKRKNWEQKTYTKVIERQAFLDQLINDEYEIDIIIHLGARTDTTEFNYAIHEELNVEYSKSLWQYATAKQIPLIYASSAATYGSGEQGYDDNHTILDKLLPLNHYGVSKNEFDKWVIAQTEQPPLWTGLKFFNVYGPNEYHKNRMASVVFHSFNQLKTEGEIKLFKSDRPDFKDGMQLRDFVYVKDAAAAVLHFLTHKKHSGIYNVGTGKASSFKSLAESLLKSIEGDVDAIKYVDMPDDLKGKYQYFTEANVKKLKDAGYTKPFLTIEEGIKDYAINYLTKSDAYA